MSPFAAASVSSILFTANGVTEQVTSTVPRIRWISSIISKRRKSFLSCSFMAVRIVKTSTSANVPSSFTTPVSIGMFCRPPPAFIT
uniref:Putative secreted protein n=1 Tax=Anopheles darlingi TaxID=43151 RepID=A0A2M4DFJ1_ANODA